jgi:hypothetical protein
MTCRVAREVLHRGLGISLILAAGSWVWRADGLVGPRGLTPVALQLADVRRAYPGNAAFELRPTAVWWMDPETSTALLCAVCVAVGIALVLRKGFEAPLLLLGWAAWLSVVNTGGIWLAFQWDNLLVESLLAAVFTARWGRAPEADPPDQAWWLVWLLVARLMFFGGLAKLLSGDPSWQDGTALTWHYWTQPLPNPLSPWMWRAPAWTSAIGVAFTFVVELVLPVAILAGWKGRAVAAAGFVLLMELLALTGNYGYFQFLAIVLSLALVDDRAWALLGVPIPAAAPPGRFRGMLMPVAAALALLAACQALVSTDLAPPAVQTVVRRADPWRSVNRYGLFATMTKQRDEILLEVTDGTGWREWPFTWKPGDVLQRPPQSAPHLPRLEWRLWFAALSNCERNRWVMQLEQKVLAREPAVIALLGPDPLDGRPITGVRTLRSAYRPARDGEPGFWVRSEPVPYCPALPIRPG